MSDRPPSIAEIAALTARLRALSAADRVEVDRFLADKQDLLDRITAAADRRPAPRGREAANAAFAAGDAVREVARARAEAGGYVLVGPSARTWYADQTGRPLEPAHEAEHQAVRDLLGSYQLDAAEPAWITAADGRTDIVSTVIPLTDDTTSLDDDLADDLDAMLAPGELGCITFVTPEDAADTEDEYEDERRAQLAVWHADDTGADVDSLNDENALDEASGDWIEQS